MSIANKLQKPEHKQDIDFKYNAAGVRTWFIAQQLTPVEEALLSHERMRKCEWDHMPADVR
jgi:hypothetical protein